jgi:hypothetical protein
VWLRRKKHSDLIACAHVTAGSDHRHHTRLADQLAVGIPIEYGRQQAREEPVELTAGIAQPGDLDERRGSELKPRTSRERKQVHASSRDVLSDAAGTHGKPHSLQLVVQLSVDQMDLAKIRLLGVSGNSRTVLNPLAQMHVALHTAPGKQPDAPSARFGEGVVAASADAHTPGCQQSLRMVASSSAASGTSRVTSACNSKPST